MPAITNLRLLARQDKLLTAQDVHDVMHVPITVGTLFDIILRHKHVLVQEFAHDFGVPLHVETIQHYVHGFRGRYRESLKVTRDNDQAAALKEETAAPDTSAPLTTTADKDTTHGTDKDSITDKDTNSATNDVKNEFPAAKAQVVIFDDEQSASELVFGIAVNQ